MITLLQTKLGRFRLTTALLLLGISATSLALENQGSQHGSAMAAVVTVPSGGDVAVTAFRDWDVQVASGQAPTMKLTNGNRMNIQLTFIPRRKPRTPSEEDQKSSVRQNAQRYVTGSVEQETILKRLPTPMGTAILTNFNNLRYQSQPPPVGEFSSITLGQVDHELMSIAVTILTQGPETPEHDDALEVLASLLMVRKET